MTHTDFIQRLRRVEVRARLVSQELMAGQCDSVFKGRGMDFVDVREYVPGDDVRRIDWNVSARFRKPYIKRLVEERELTVMILVDLSASGHFGTAGNTKREVAAELAGTLALSAIRNNDRVGMILFTQTVEHYLPPRKTRQHAQRMLRDLLTHVPRSTGTGIAHAMEFAQRVLHRPSLIFLLTDLHDTGHEAVLNAANQRHDVLVLQTVDPRELSLPDVGLAMVQDAETGDILEVDTGDTAVRAGYERAVAERQAGVESFFRKARIAHLPIHLDRPWPNPLRAFLARHARRRVA